MGDDFAERVGDDFDTPRASDPVVLALELGSELFLGPDAEALGHEAAEGVTTTQGTNASFWLGQSNGHPSSEKRLQEGRGLA